LEYWAGIAMLLERYACVATKSEQHLRALRLGGAAEGLRRWLFTPARPAEQAELDKRLAVSWAAVEQRSASAKWTSGSEMDRDAAVALALGLEVEE